MCSLYSACAAHGELGMCSATAVLPELSRDHTAELYVAYTVLLVPAKTPSSQVAPPCASYTVTFPT